MYAIDTYEVNVAYGKCRRRKRHTQQEQDFSMHVSDNLLAFCKDLVKGTYQPLPNRTFLVDYPVLREVFAPQFRDRIDHHLVAEKLEPLLERELINDCYSCRKGKGTLFGIKRMRRFIAQCSRNYTRDCYILSGDISGYFMSIDRLKLWSRLSSFVRSRYKGEDLDSFLWQLEKFVFSSPLDNVVVRGEREKWRLLPDNKSLFCACGVSKPCDYDGIYHTGMIQKFVGLPIGALLAQMLGNFFLSPFDHFCKSVEKLRFYGRYVDDFFVVHTNRKFLLMLVKRLRQYLADMGLMLHPHKIRIVHYSQGVPFLGAFIRGAVLLPGKRVVARFIQLLEQIDSIHPESQDVGQIEHYMARLNSYLGLMRHFNARRLVDSALAVHPVVHDLFYIDTLPYKAVSWYRIRQRKEQKCMVLAGKLYHHQFRRRWHGHFRSRQIIYNGLLQNIESDYK